MVSLEEIAARFGEDSIPMIRFPKAAVERLAIGGEDQALLVQVGLPADAAPFLSFKGPKSSEPPTVADEWRLGEGFKSYRLIGSDGSGNPIAIDEASRGEVVCLDHENRFARILINKTVCQLVESLLAYRKLVKDTQREFGEDAFLDGKIPAAARKGLRDALASTDSTAVTPGSFWHGELQNLDANAGQAMIT
jgi:SUKH-4 immunity protein